jgi:hypothetical protein
VATCDSIRSSSPVVNGFAFIIVVDTPYRKPSVVDVTTAT